MANVHVGGEFFLVHTNRCVYGVEGFAETSLSLIATAGFLLVRRVTSLFRVATLTHAVDRWPAGGANTTTTQHTFICLVHTYTDIDREKMQQIDNKTA